MVTTNSRRRRPARKAGPPQIELRVAARNAAHAARVIRAAAREFALPDEWISMSLVGDKEISRLNLDWRGRGSPTDVLSWSPGEIVISLDTARRQAREGGWTLALELRRLLAHGILHCRGYDHDAAARMAAAERRMLGRDGMVGESLSEREGKQVGRRRRPKSI
ncbi:MAG: rRNA maturation RNase YbeY [Deltaproteobacteria bacterium]|nr:MAG: rRNA maturation RNase YbeY [Deltaproteobacteria bacterium]